MHSAQSRARRPVLNAVCLAALTGVLGVVMFAALRSPLKDDIAWLLYVAHRWMAGKELYVDVIEVNPPLIVWMSAIPITVARVLGISQQLAAMSAFSAIALGCAWWSACMLRPMGGVFAGRIPVFAVIGAVLLIIPAADLGQREHLLVAAFLPYLIVFARTLPRRPAPGDGPGGAIASDGEAGEARPTVVASVAVGVAGLRAEAAIRHRLRGIGGGGAGLRTAPLASRPFGGGGDTGGLFRSRGDRVPGLFATGGAIGVGVVRGDRCFLHDAAA
jgi:hypothetical protein